MAQEVLRTIVDFKSCLEMFHERLGGQECTDLLYLCKPQINLSSEPESTIPHLHKRKNSRNAKGNGPHLPPTRGPSLPVPPTSLKNGKTPDQIWRPSNLPVGLRDNRDPHSPLSGAALRSI